jgi:hypothetical protein
VVQSHDNLIVLSKLPKVLFIAAAEQTRKDLQIGAADFTIGIKNTPDDAIQYIFITVL